MTWSVDLPSIYLLKVNVSLNDLPEYIGPGRTRGPILLQVTDLGLRG